MMIRVGYELVFQVPARTPMLLALYTHPSRAASLRESDQVHVEPDVPVEVFTDPFGNRCGRLVAPPGKLRLWNMSLIEDSGEPDEVRATAQQQPVENIPPELLPASPITSKSQPLTPTSIGCCTASFSAWNIHSLT